MASLHMERLLWRHGCRRVAGADEVGRGPLAGPVVAAVCILAPGADLSGVNDSKQLSEKQREAAFGRILAAAAAWGIAAVPVERIDSINIRNASFEAVRLALSGAHRRGPADPDELAAALEAGTALSPEPVACDFLIYDGNAPLPGYAGVQRCVVGGDGKVLSVAAASIIAKVVRDRMARRWEAAYPGYGFARHKGYATAEHIAALGRLGPCPLHRRSFLGGRQVRLVL